MKGPVGEKEGTHRSSISRKRADTRSSPPNLQLSFDKLTIFCYRTSNRVRKCSQIMHLGISELTVIVIRVSPEKKYHTPDFRF